ncbi:MAG: hypothetical protein KBF57_02770 [Saprospiraceae bacterium]|nr:hypothetical protein [Saprospiraceae bacterium]
MKNHITIAFILFFVSNDISAQILKTKFLLTYDTAHCEYIVNLFIEEGSTKNLVQGANFGCRVGIVAPYGAKLKINNVFNPKKNNGDPITFSFENTPVTPASCSSQTFHAASVSMTPTSFYPVGTEAGDTIALFSFSVDSQIKNCGSEIRLFDNLIDPSIENPEMQGQDFSNFIRIGAVYEKHFGILKQKTANHSPLKGIDLNIDEDLTINPLFNSSSCTYPLEFTWDGPNGFTSKSMNISIKGFSTQNEGYYKLKVTNNLGCSFNYEIPASSQIYTSRDTAICPGSSLILNGYPATLNGKNGYWRDIPSSLGKINNLDNGMAILEVVENTVPGIYKLVYEIDNSVSYINFTVNPSPTTPPFFCPFCTSDTIELPAIDEGHWVSSTPSILEIIEGKEARGIQSGRATLYYVDNNTGCISNPLSTLVQESMQVNILGPHDICQSGSTILFPSTGGTWQTEPQGFGSINNSGIVTGLSPGTFRARFTPTNNSCLSNTLTEPITVLPSPIISYLNLVSLCVGETAGISPTVGGRWKSSNPNVASISNSGLIKALKPGNVEFLFTSDTTGCTSNNQSQILVNDLPVIRLNFEDTLCQNQNGTYVPVNNGAWTSSNNSVLTINNIGVIHAHAAGIANIIVHSTATNCTSLPKTIYVQPDSLCTEKAYYRIKVFLDLNKNGIFDIADEFGLSNASITISNNNTTFFTFANSEILLNLPITTRTFTVHLPFGTWEENPIVRTIDLKSTDKLEFGFISKNVNNSILAYHIIPLLRCNNKSEFKPIIFNDGNTNFNGKVKLNYEKRVLFSGSKIEPYFKNDSMVIWEINNLAPGNVFIPSYEAICPLPKYVGDSLDFKLTVYNNNNEVFFEQNYPHVIRCSFDPNDLQVRPDRIGEENLTLRTEALTYQVRFQNTGNDTAFYVRIDDVLHKDIDRRSLMLIDASHKGRLILCSNDTLCYIMDTIQLVDDKTSYEASQGYVVFTAKTKFDIAEGTVVPNQAHIFFDANAPVITNAVKNTIVTSLPCPDNALTQDGPWLVATEGGNQYTWIDCSNEQILEQSDAPLYKPEKNGSYRVAVKGDYCTVESECIPFVVNSVSDIKDGLLIYPTLVNDVFYIQSEQAVEKITLSSLSGVLHTLPSQWLGNNLTSVTLPAVASGYYVVAVVTKGRVYTRGVVKM